MVNGTFTAKESGSGAGYGRRFTSKIDGYTEKSIFLPAAGYRRGASLDYQGSGGYYWSSSLLSDGPNGAWDLCFNSGSAGMYRSNRYYGYSVRAVQSK
jgi:hypothetical protein